MEVVIMQAGEKNNVYWARIAKKNSDGNLSLGFIHSLEAYTEGETVKLASETANNVQWQS